MSLIETTTLTNNEAASFFGLTPENFRQRSIRVDGHPEPIRDTRVPGRIFWKLNELRAFSRAFHEQHPDKCLFSARRVLQLDAQERAEWGLAPSPQRRTPNERAIPPGHPTTWHYPDTPSG